MNVSLLLVHLGYLGTGLMIARVIGISGSIFQRRRLLVSYVVGLVADVSILYVVASFRPIPHTLIRLMSVIGVFCLAYFIGVAVRNQWLGTSVAEGEPSKIVAYLRSPSIWISVLLVVVLVPPTLSTLMIGKTVPVFGWDGIAIWASKSSALFHGEYLQSEYFLNEDRVHAHPGYPIGYPLFQLHNAGMFGAYQETLLTRGLVVVFFLWLLAYFDLIQEFAGRNIGLAACALLMYTPVFFSPAAMAMPLSGFADFLIGSVVVVSAGWLFSWLVHGHELDLLGASAAMIAVVGIKNEGMIWMALIFGIAILGVVVLRIKVGKRELSMLLLPIAALAAVRLIHVHLPTSSDVHLPNLDQLGQLYLQIPKLAGIGLDALSWQNRPLALLPLIIVSGFVMGTPRHWRNRYAVVALVGPLMWGIIFVVMGLTEIQLGSFDRFVRVTFPRLLFQAVPVSLYWAIILNSPLFPRWNTTRKVPQVPHQG